ncbi:MAG: retroviral-like aspartic protease family protein [Myxococcota bacterium]
MSARARIAAGLGALVCALSVSAASAEVYRWTDERGREHWTGDLSRVPPGKRSEALDGALDAGPSRLQLYEGPPSAATRTSARKRSGVLRIPYEQHGNAILVYARLNDRVEAPFYVDTGAADVVVPAAVAAQAGIHVGPGTPRETYATANGLVRQAVISFDAIEVGEARVENVRGSVSESLPVGLLGTSFFNHFTLQIDPAARMLTLVVNPNMRGGASEAQWRERFRELQHRIARIEAYLDDGTLTSETRVRELTARRDTLAERLDQLETEANRAEVPAGWRE